MNPILCGTKIFWDSYFKFSVYIVFYKIEHLSKFSVALLIAMIFLDKKLCLTLFKGKMPSTFLHLNVFNDVCVYLNSLCIFLHMNV